MKRKKIKRIIEKATKRGEKKERIKWKVRYKKSMRRWKIKYVSLFVHHIWKNNKLENNIDAWEKKNEFFNKSIERIARKEKLMMETLQGIIKLTAKFERINRTIKEETAKVEKKFEQERSSILRLVRNG